MNQQHTFGLEIYASNRQFYVGRGESITFPVEDGQMQVLPHHEDMIAAIVPGEMDFVDANGEKITVAVSAGFTEVFNNRIKVFALTVDPRPAEEPKERAEEQLRQKKSLDEYNANQMALARAMSRLRVTSRKRI